MSKLTGRTRYRVHKTLFRKPVLVLQLEVEVLVVENLGGYIDTSTKNTWVDATLQQIMLGRFAEPRSVVS